MKMVALRFHLHPLALEDALRSHNQRAKAESYTGHYFISVPLFFVEYENESEGTVAAGESQRTTLSASFRRLLACCQRQRMTSEPNTDTKGGLKQKQAKVSRIGSETTSIFVSMPTGKTVITFNKLNKKKGVNLNSGERHLTELTDSWSRVKDDLKKSYSKLRQYNGQYLCYSLLYQVVDVIGPVVKKMRHAISDEMQVLRDLKYRNMTKIHTFRDDLKSMARKLKPVRNLLIHVIEDETISPGP
jgi:Mg2+ and Co2+ transporter CorA